MRRIILVLASLVALAAGPANTPATQPATQPSTRPAKLDLAQVLRHLPKDARPGKEGWDEFSRPAAHKWIIGELRGKTVLVSASVSSAGIERIPNADDPDKTDGWAVSLKLDPSPVRGLPFAATQSFVARNPKKPKPAYEDKNALGGGTDEATARIVKALKPGDAVSVRGEILDVEIESDGRGKDTAYSFVVVLADVKIEAPQPSRKK